MTAAPPSGAGGFEEHLDRWGTHSAKWDLLAARLGPEAVSMSVADMELRTAPCVIDAVTAAARHGTYGYTEVFDDFRRAAVLWQRERHGWAPEPGCVRFFPRVVQCVSALLNVVLPDRRAARPVVVTLDPAYGPLLEVAERSGAEIRRVPLLLDDFPASPARIDIPALERALDGADLFLLCNPHNPTGRIWTAEELGAVADAVLPTGVLVLSDDIHADFQRPGRTRYAPIASTRPALWESGRLIQCASPGKTFTIAGLEATAVLAPGDLGDELEAAKRRMGLHNPSYFAIPAAIAAWTRGGPWVDRLRAFIDANLAEAVRIVRAELPRARVADPDGTYLIWVDARSYLRDEADLDRAVRACRVAVTPGEDFGERYAGWFRINTALPAGELAAALPRLCREIRAVGAVGAAEAGSTAGAAEAGSTASAAGSQSRSVPTH